MRAEELERAEDSAPFDWGDDLGESGDDDQRPPLTNRAGAGLELSAGSWTRPAITCRTAASNRGSVSCWIRVVNVN